ncbi:MULTISPECIES: response regulator transcription factor [unclassified Imperialibacter]|uniref:response regulator n=1 Tax=unclassified Imperialibacter TaxID=2629706 RepID=UPI0012529DB8|nr:MULTISPECIES: response regulator transcription factor [unclassified Imperialibacter]CAD5277158.1 Response regulator UvrY [Imperialibacter sp. 75]CAD5295140.1 Response regulator UvrY [Imperialibacter sp. 89]VVT12217.1 Response regulator UvrY [Imperialibacter sp. EC-SDR9]
MIRILIADDHSMIRRGLREILLDEFGDASITEASTGTELLKLAQSREWDILISDISMPGQNGLDILKQLKEQFPNKPILILSMHPEDQYAIRALRAGAAGYLTKESASNELVAAVRKVLAGKRYISATVAEKLAETLDKDAEKALHETLSDREFAVMKLLASGSSVSEVANTLSLSVTTISTFRARILKKMGLKSNADLTQYAIHNQLI